MIQLQQGEKRTSVKTNPESNITLLGVDSVYVGVDTGQPLYPDFNTHELPKTRYKIEPKKIYSSVQVKKNTNWFILDLQTGGKGYFPGAMVTGRSAKDLQLKDTPEAGANLVDIIPAEQSIEILETLSAINKNNYIQVRYNDQVGYVPRQELIIEYKSPV